MFKSVSDRGNAPVEVVKPCRLGAVLVLAAAALGGCAADNSAHYSHVAAWPITPVLMSVPDRPSAEASASPLPVDRAPLRRLQRENDDPTEPYSPNYGPIPYKPLHQPQVREAQEASFRTDVQPAPTWSRTQQDVMIAQARADHERRYP